MQQEEIKTEILDNSSNICLIDQENKQNLNPSLKKNKKKSE